MKKIMLFLLAVFVCISAPATAEAAAYGNILINEIAWMGNASSANDEWVELFNATNNPIDFSGWVLKSADGTPEIKLSGTVFANEFYLLERTDDNSAPNALADQIYTGALGNGGEDLNLYDEYGNLIDRANFSYGWTFGDKETKQTAERIPEGWQTSKDPNGTPKLKNSPGKLLEKVIVSQSYSEGIILNEILPAPEGPDESDEWIELFNKNNFEVYLSNWKLRDAKGTGTTYAFSENTKISANGYLVLERPQTKIVLNNGGDSLDLIWPDGTIIDSISYEKAVKKQSYSRLESGWQWSVNLTPGSKNVIVFPEKEILPKQGEVNSKTSAAAAVSDSTIQLLDNTIQSKQGEKNKSSPLYLFLTALGAIIMSGAGILIWKLKLLRK